MGRLLRSESAARLASILFRSVIAGMLLVGFGDDLVDAFQQRPFLPDRLIFGIPEGLAAWSQGHPVISSVTMLLELVASSLLFVGGIAMLAAVKQDRGLWFVSGILGLALLDDIPGGGFWPELYFSCYWPALFACFVSLGARVPLELTPASIEAHAAVRAGRHVDGMLAAVDRAMLRPWFVWGVASTMAALSFHLSSLLDDAAETARSTPLLALGGWLLLVFVVVYVSMGLRYFLIGYRLADEQRRRRFHWLFQGVWLYLVGYLTLLTVFLVARLTGLTARFPGIEDVLPVAYLAVVVAASACLLVSIFYDGSLDPSWAIRKTTMCGLLSVVGGTLFAVVENLVADTLANLVALPYGLVAGALGAATIGIAALPVRRLFLLLTDVLGPMVAPSLEHDAVLLCSELVGLDERLGSDRRVDFRGVALFRRVGRAVARRHRGRVVQASGHRQIISFVDPERGIGGGTGVA